MIKVVVLAQCQTFRRASINVQLLVSNDEASKSKGDRSSVTVFLELAEFPKETFQKYHHLNY